MAFDFIKKVFTFGRKAEEENAPAPTDQPTLAPYIGIAPQPNAKTQEPAPAVLAEAPNRPALRRGRRRTSRPAGWPR